MIASFFKKIVEWSGLVWARLFAYRFTFLVTRNYMEEDAWYVVSFEIRKKIPRIRNFEIKKK